MYGPVRHLAELNIVYQTSMAALDRVLRVFTVTPRIVERRNAVSRTPSRGEVEFSHVKFCYDDDSEESRIRLDDEPREDQHTSTQKKCQRLQDWVLDDLTFRVEPGESVALVGPSGSGKSTLASLLPRLYDVIEGRILVDGVDVREYRLKELRKAIAIVQQQSLVFSGTIRDNLCYGHSDVSEERMIEAARDANAHEFISALDQSYSTLLGERGRHALRRAVAANFHCPSAAAQSANPDPRRSDQRSRHRE